MTLKLYAHPFSSYCQKALIALYENGTPFDWKMLSADHPEIYADADWAHPVEPRFNHVHAYRKRLLARPSFARAVDEARPYRALFPLGAPDRD